MKRFILSIFGLLLLAGTGAFAQQTFSGQVVDEHRQPFPYVNVVLLAPSDSAFVAGMVSDGQGRFSLRAPETGLLLRVSFVGYTTIYKVADRPDLGIVTLLPDAQMLDGVTIRANLPKVRLKGDAQVTTVQGSVLEKAGTGNDLLDRIPGLSADEGTVNVFGSGQAEVYINGRKMRNASELDQLSSDNIRSVEVVRTPGARYDASVKAVVRIYTKRPQGEGLGVNERLSTNYRYGWSVLDQLDLNYRRGGFDLGAMLYLSDSRNEDNKGLVQETFLDHTWRQESDLRTANHSQNLETTLRLNYQFNDRHSVGAYYDFDRTPRNKWSIPPLPTTVYLDDELYETSSSSGWENRTSYAHSANIYYNGRLGDWLLDFNADGLWSTAKTPQDMLEQVTAAGAPAPQEQTVTNRSQQENTLYAAKLLVEHPLWGGNLSLGGEYTYTDRLNRYTNAEGILQDDDSRIRENAWSAFLEYGRFFGKLQARAGVRYEHLVSDYYEQGRRIGEQSRTYDNVFPSLSLLMPVGKDVQLQLAYSGSIDRPGYWLLRNSVTYMNRYTYESGNPSLKPSLVHRLSLNAAWKWVYLNLGYQHVCDGFLYHSGMYSEENPTISLIQYINTTDADYLNAALTLAPTIGLWSPQFNAMLSRQWFYVDTPDGRELFNHPMASFQWRNTLDLPLGFQLSVDLSARTRGHQESFHIFRPSWSMNASLYKGFLKDRLSLQLQATDLFNSSQAPLTLYSGNRLMTIDQEARRRVSLTLRYKFNAAKSKYKGTGAGQSQRDRM